jgi:hypothetical protein
MNPSKYNNQLNIYEDAVFNPKLDIEFEFLPEFVEKFSLYDSNG